MEKPVSTKGEDIRDEKVKVLRSVLPIKMEDVVIGQYVGDKESKDPEHQQGYLDDKGVPKDSRTPTFAQMVLSINNERWAGVPFILRAGIINCDDIYNFRLCVHLKVKRLMKKKLKFVFNFGMPLVECLMKIFVKMILMED